MRLLLVVYVLAVTSACAAAWYLQQPMTLDEYQTARVRIYHTGMNCRIEVTTARETIHTIPTRCVTLPLRVQP